MRAALVALLLVVLGVNAGPGAPQSSSRPGCFIAHRYDDSRVVFSVGKTVPGEPELKRRNLAQNPSRLPDPSAKLAGMTLWKMDEGFWKRHAGALPGPLPGDRWILQSGGVKTLHFTIERLVIAETECGTTIAALGVVDPAEQAVFRGLSEKHYLIISEASHTAGAPAEAGPAILKDPVLGAEGKEKLEESLRERFERELPRIRRSAAPNYALMGRLGREHPWLERDQRLAQGEGKLSYDLQALRLTPEGQPLYFVRAQWTLDDKTAFLMSAWVRPDRDMQLDSVNTYPSEWLRMNEFQSERLGLDDLGAILNVFDYDGDGWGEILINQRRYEGYQMILLEYSEGQGFRRTGIGFRYGC